MLVFRVCLLFTDLAGQIFWLLLIRYCQAAGGIRVRFAGNIFL